MIKRPVDVIMSEKVNGYAKRADLKISVTWRDLADCAWVKVDGHALQRALANLIDNSADAVEGAGSITVEVSRHDGQVKITVSDTADAASPPIFYRA